MEASPSTTQATAPLVVRSRSSSGGEVAPIDPLYLDAFWPLLGGFIAMAVERPECSSRGGLDDVYLDILNDSSQLWVIMIDGVIAGAAVTRIHEYPSDLKMARIEWCGGAGVERWKDAIATIESWAKDNGCAGLEIQGRRGWGRVFPEYTEVFTLFEKRF